MLVLSKSKPVGKFGFKYLLEEYYIMFSVSFLAAFHILLRRSMSILLFLVMANTKVSCWHQQSWVRRWLLQLSQGTLFVFCTSGHVVRSRYSSLENISNTTKRSHVFKSSLISYMMPIMNRGKHCLGNIPISPHSWSPRDMLTSTH